MKPGEVRKSLSGQMLKRSDIFIFAKRLENRGNSALEREFA
jgi:hypothetical protein